MTFLDPSSNIVFNSIIWLDDGNDCIMRVKKSSQDVLMKLWKTRKIEWGSCYGRTLSHCFSGGQGSLIVKKEKDFQTTKYFIHLETVCLWSLMQSSQQMFHILSGKWLSFLREYKILLWRRFTFAQIFYWYLIVSDAGDQGLKNIIQLVTKQSYQ